MSVLQDGAYSANFTVANPNATSITYALSCAASAPVTSCASASSLVVAANSSATTSVTFSTGSAGVGGITLTANGTGGADTGTVSVLAQRNDGNDVGSYDVTVQAPPSVTPDGGTANVYTGSTCNVATFTIANLNPWQVTYSLTCDGPGSNCTAPSTVTVDPHGEPPRVFRRARYVRCRQRGLSLLAAVERLLEVGRP